MEIDFGRGFHAPDGHAADPTAYDAYVGRWSRLFVPELLAAARVGIGDRVLDVATGLGEAASQALALVHDSGVVVGSDISPGMLGGARTRLAGLNFLSVAADGKGLPFRDAAFDAVLCQLGLQFFPQPLLGLMEMRRVLRAGRRAVACVIGTADQAPVWGVLASVLSSHFSNKRETLNLSFALANPDELKALFVAAGFGDVRIDHETRDSDFESFEAYWTPIEAGVGMLPQAYRSLPEPRRRAVKEQVRHELRKFDFGGRLKMILKMLIASGLA